MEQQDEETEMLIRTKVIAYENKLRRQYYGQDVFATDDLAS